jgi:hypothetical protein
MKLYNILVKYNKSGKIDDIIAINDSFSWKSFFFNPLWFIFNKMWLESLLFVVILILFSLISSHGFFGSYLLYLFFFMVALNAKYWKIEALISKKKYQLSAFVFGKNIHEARNNFIQQITHKSSSHNHEIFGDKILDPKNNP